MLNFYIINVYLIENDYIPYLLSEWNLHIFTLINMAKFRKRFCDDLQLSCIGKLLSVAESFFLCCQVGIFENIQILRYQLGVHFRSILFFSVINTNKIFLHPCRFRKRAIFHIFAWFFCKTSWNVHYWPILHFGSIATGSRRGGGISKLDFRIFFWHSISGELLKHNGVHSNILTLLLVSVIAFNLGDVFILPMFAVCLPIWCCRLLICVHIRQNETAIKKQLLQFHSSLSYIILRPASVNVYDITYLHVYVVWLECSIGGCWQSWLPFVVSIRKLQVYGTRIHVSQISHI